MLFNLEDWEILFILGVYLLQLGKKTYFLAFGTISETGVRFCGEKNRCTVRMNKAKAQSYHQALISESDQTGQMLWGRLFEINDVVNVSLNFQT